MDHNISNEAELVRLANLGTDIEKLLKVGKIGTNNTYTRTIGDHDLKARIREMEYFRYLSSPVCSSDTVLMSKYLKMTTEFCI